MTLSYVSWALILRVMRSSMLESLRENHEPWLAQGRLREKVVIDRHVRPNALIPIVTIGGLVLVGWMGGVVAIQTVSNIRGLGWFFATAALQLDIISVLGLTLFNAAVLIMGNLFVDVQYGFIDPRVRLE